MVRALASCSSNGHSLTDSLLGRDHKGVSSSDADCWASNVADVFFRDTPCSEGYGYDWWGQDEQDKAIGADDHDQHNALQGPPTFDCSDLCAAFTQGATAVGMVRLFEHVWSDGMQQRERTYVRRPRIVLHHRLAALPMPEQRK